MERIMREATDFGVDEPRRERAELSPLRPSEDSDVDGAADASDAGADVAADPDVTADSVGGVAAATLAAAAALSCGDLLNVYVSTRVVWAGAIISLDSDAHTVHARMDWFDGTERSDVTLAGTKPLNSFCCRLQRSTNCSIFVQHSNKKTLLIFVVRCVHRTECAQMGADFSRQIQFHHRFLGLKVGFATVFRCLMQAHWARLFANCLRVSCL